MTFAQLFPKPAKVGWWSPGHINWQATVTRCVWPALTTTCFNALQAISPDPLWTIGLWPTAVYVPAGR